MGKKFRKEKNSVNNSLDNLADDFKKVGKDFTNVYKEHVFKRHGFRSRIKSLRGNRQGKFLATILVGLTIMLLILSKVGIPIALILLFLVFLLLIEDK